MKKIILFYFFVLIFIGIGCSISSRVERKEKREPKEPSNIIQKISVEQKEITPSIEPDSIPSIPHPQSQYIGIEKNLYITPENLLKLKLDSLITDYEKEGVKIGTVITDVKNDPSFIYTHNANQLFCPASNQKIITAYLALSYLKQNYRFQTNLYYTGRIRNHRLFGDLYLKGGGDPTLSYIDFYDFLLMLRRYGIEAIEGNLILDDTFFYDGRLGKGWMWDDIKYSHCKEISALSLNQNQVRIIVLPTEVGELAHIELYPPSPIVNIKSSARTSGNKNNINFYQDWENDLNNISISGYIKKDNSAITKKINISDPTLNTGKTFAYFLNNNGINISGRIMIDKVPKEAKILYRHYSDDLFHILKDAIKYSDNFYSEMIIRTIAAKIDSGKSVAKFLDTFSDTILPDYKLRMVDGSGLSRYNLISPVEIVTILNKAYKDISIRPEFMSLLPISGLDGTISRRLKDKKYKIRAKTGVMTGISALSGYAFTDDGVKSFSIMMEDYLLPAWQIRLWQDNICRIIIDTYSKR